MEYKYIIHSGKVEEKGEKLIFRGEVINSTNPLTNDVMKAPLCSQILFPMALKEGRIKMDVKTKDICKFYRCGFVFQHSFVDGISKFYNVAINNTRGFCSLNYYNGSEWEFLCSVGSDESVKPNKKYSLEMRLNGNRLAFLVDDVLMFEYTKIMYANGVCGIFSYSESDTEVSNLEIVSAEPTAFSIMKFEKDFDELYQNVITPICESYGYKSIRADECYASTPIIQDIIREISNASLIIADVTMDNPNVFYELGYAHALGKPTILLADKSKREHLPFDVSGYRTIFYENTIGGKKEIELMLRKFIDNIMR